VSRRGKPAREQRTARAASAHRTRNARKPQRIRSRSRRAASQRRSSPVFSRCLCRMAMRRPADLVTIAGVHIVDRRVVTPARAGTSGKRRGSPRAEQQARRIAERCGCSDRCVEERLANDRSIKARSRAISVHRVPTRRVVTLTTTKLIAKRTHWVFRRFLVGFTMKVHHVSERTTWPK